MRVVNSKGTNREMITNRTMTRMLGLLPLLLIFASSAAAFVSRQPSEERVSASLLGAAPKRLADNVEGPLYVNEKVRPTLFKECRHACDVRPLVTFFCVPVYQLCRL
jgi:hypothetical protein